MLFFYAGNPAVSQVLFKLFKIQILHTQKAIRVSTGDMKIDVINFFISDYHYFYIV